MTGNEYQELALRTANPETLKEQQSALLNGVLGLVGEAGEIADTLKKNFFQGHSIDMESVAKELGDVMWYVALTSYALGYKLDAILEMNIGKLRARYPEGFDVDRSINRKE